MEPVRWGTEPVAYCYSNLGTALAAQRISCIRGGSQPPTSGRDSIIEVVGENNPEHFFIATLDPELKKAIRKVSAVYSYRESVVARQSQDRRLFLRKRVCNIGAGYANHHLTEH